jgi:molybdate transport repressor ModE-like protein
VVGRYLPDLDALELLMAVSRHGSIGAAARATGVTQQSASERLHGMERLIGVSLLRPSARGTELTRAGRLVVEWSARLLAVADEMDASLTALRSERGRQLHIVASMTVAEHLLPRWLVAFGQRRSETQVSLNATNSRDVLNAIDAGLADLGFVEGVRPPARLRHRNIATDELVLVTAPDSPLARRRRPLDPHQIAELALTSRERGSGTRDVVERAFAVHGLVPAPPVVEVTTSTALREAVRAGGAAAFISRRAVQADLQSGALREVRTTGLDLTRTFRAVWAGPAQPPAGPVRDLLAVASALG